MADDEKRMVPVPCAKCGEPPVVAVPIAPGGPYVNLCYPHYQEWEVDRQRKIKLYRELADQAEDQIADVFGVPRKQRPVRIPAPEVNVQQIHIHGDNLGVVNTGTVGALTNSLTVINGRDPELALRLKTFTEAVIASPRLNDGQKREATDLLNDIVADAAKPVNQRRSATVTKTVIHAMSQVISQAAVLYTLWTAIHPHLT